MQHMDFREIGWLVSSYTIVLEFLWKRKGLTECPNCGASEFYNLGRTRVRCQSYNGISGLFKIQDFH
jgi:hypothetical protein